LRLKLKTGSYLFTHCNKCDLFLLVSLSC
jgi:hypothetical protein